MEGYLIAFALGVLVMAIINLYAFVMVEKIGENNKKQELLHRKTIKVDRTLTPPKPPKIKEIGFRKE